MRSVDSLSEVHAWFPRVGNSGVAPCVRLEEPANYGSIHSVCIVQQQNRCNFRDRAARTRRETRDRIRKQEDITSPVIELRILPKDRDREKERARERERERMTSIDSFFLLCLAFTGINPFPPGLWCHLPMRSTRVISLFTGESRARWFSGLHETLIVKDTMNEYRNAWLRNTSRHATYYASFISERKMPLRWK